MAIVVSDGSDAHIKAAVHNIAIMLCFVSLSYQQKSAEEQPGLPLVSNETERRGAETYNSPYDMNGMSKGRNNVLRAYIYIYDYRNTSCCYKSQVQKLAQQANVLRTVDRRQMAGVRHMIDALLAVVGQRKSLAMNMKRREQQY